MGGYLGYLGDSVYWNGGVDTERATLFFNSHRDDLDVWSVVVVFRYNSEAVLISSDTQSHTSQDIHQQVTWRLGHWE